ncbi:porin family protein [Thalassolituus sp.]|jgi:OOP family OmpA-OmpF porin|uniref:porin family protein n=1 Tax=Thalassolituus sp. TaxID=2030822 RepID=UPI002A7F6CDE|nr:porin family protein [Thalassolituus sp.]
MNKHPILKAGLIALGALASTSAIANENMYMTFGAGYFDNDPFGDVYDEQGIRARHSYEIEASLGYMFNNNFAVEGSVVMPSPTQASERADINQFRLSGLYFFGEKALKPYVALGLGQEEFEKDGYPSLDSRGGFLSLGAGIQYEMNDEFFGRVEARIDDLQDNISYHAVYMLEVGYRFGIESSDRVASYDAEKSAVAANDFSSEYYDGCCTEGKAEDAGSAEAMQLDTEQLAALPATAAGSNDDDHGGIANDLDQCALTAKGLTVDANGCAQFTGSISNVLFEVESSVLSVSIK